MLYRLSYMGRSLFRLFDLALPPLDARDAIVGAGNGTRTRDPQLGRLMLYQLSYSRPMLFLYLLTSTIPRARVLATDVVERRRIRTFVGLRPADLQSAPFNHSGTPPRSHPLVTARLAGRRSFLAESLLGQLVGQLRMELAKGLEPPTGGLQNRCSTN